jgi:hypothetical protein
MALVVTPVSVEDTGHEMLVTGTIAASGNYATGGDTLDWTPVGAGVNGRNFGIAQGPKAVINVYGISGYVYAPVAGTAINNWKLKAFQSAGSAAPMAELGAGAYPGGVTGDTINFSAIFRKLQ